MTPAQIAEMLRLHSAWLRGEAGGMRADLHWADLHGANLGGADLSWAPLSWANLGGADLRGANLHGANLYGANLHGADLRWADLSGTCLDPSAPVPPCSDADLASSGLHPRRVNGRDRVYGWRTRDSPHVGTHDYTPGRWHKANALSVDRATPCHTGIYLGGLDHCPGPAPGRVLVWAYRDELVWVNPAKGARARRVWVVGERDEVPNGKA